MTALKVNIKISEGAVIPRYAKPGDAGLDLTATREYIDPEDAEGTLSYGTGLFLEIPAGYGGLILPRSSIRAKNLSLANAPGLIDSAYRGEIIVKFKITKQPATSTTCYNVGDRIAQLVILPIPYIQFVEVEELSTTERGTGGFGHTGK